MQALCDFREDSSAALLLSRLSREALCLKKTSKLPRQDGRLGGMVLIKEARIGRMQEHSRSDDFVEYDDRDRHHGFGIELGGGKMRRIERVRTDCLLTTDRFSRNGALAGLQTRIAKALCHPSVGLGANQLVRRSEVPDISATHFEIGASAPAEEAKNFRSGKAFGCRARKLK